MPRRTKKEAEATRAKILDVALSLFSQKGFVRTTLDDIAREAGYTRGAVYWHFKDKVDLFLALSEEVERSAHVDLEALVATRARSLADIREALVGYLMVFETNERYRDFYELVNYRTEWTAELEPVLARDRKNLRALVKSLKKDFAWLRSRGMVRKNLDPGRGALATCAFVEGLIGIWIFDRGLFSMTREGPRMVDDYLRGLEPVATRNTEA